MARGVPGVIVLAASQEPRDQMWALAKFFIIVIVAFLAVFTLIDFFFRKKD
jgi:hypothetical protein